MKNKMNDSHKARFAHYTPEQLKAYMDAFDRDIGPRPKNNVQNDSSSNKENI